jgi:hypothetical protein
VQRGVLPAPRGGGAKRKVFYCVPCAHAVAGAGEQGLSEVTLPLRKPELTILTHAEGRDVTVLGHLF